MSYPQVRLVDAPTASATVLFDFNDDTASAKRFVLDEGFSLGVPELVGDVDAVDPLYGPRTVSFTLRLTGTKANALAAQSALARRLLAGPGWLQVRLHATSDLLFFRTYRAQPGDLSFERVMSTATNSVDDWDLDIELPCEPFAYGEKVTQAAQTINNNPALGTTNPCRILLPTIIGDSPTALRIATQPGSSYANRRMMFSLVAATQIRYHKSDQVVGTNGTDTSGTSPRTVSFATNSSLTTRLTGTTPDQLVPGRYKVLIRVGLVSQAAVTLRATIAGVPGQIVQAGPGVASPDYTWVELGTWQLPAAPLPAWETQYGNVSPSLVIEAGRTSAGGSLQLFQMMMLPVGGYDVADSRTLFATFTTPLSSTEQGVFDGDSTSFWGLTTGGAQTVIETRPEIEGSFPRAIPGKEHVLTLLQQVDGPLSSSTDLTGNSASITVSYHPRWLWIGDS